jgi:succinate dehydrogenase / fumarate reductase cytochrome b subunit
MAEARSPSAPAGATGDLARRLHSVFGVVPVGAFLVFHLATNAAALRGADAYNAMTRRLQGLPLVLLVEILVIAVPLFFHGIYGLFRIATDASDPRRSPGRGRLTFAPGRRALMVAQQVTGVGLFAFVLFHLWTARLVQIHDHESLDLFRLMQSALANPWIRTAYVLGILSATFHLSAGLWTFAESWGFLSTARVRRLAAVASAAVFIGLSALGLSTLSAFRL